MRNYFFIFGIVFIFIASCDHGVESPQSEISQSSTRQSEGLVEDSKKELSEPPTSGRLFESLYFEEVSFVSKEDLIQFVDGIMTKELCLNIHFPIHILS